MEQSQVSDAECWKETLLQSASVDEVSVMLQHDLWEVIRLLPEPEQEKFLLARLCRRRPQASTSGSRKPTGIPCCRHALEPSNEGLPRHIGTQAWQLSAEDIAWPLPRWRPHQRPEAPPQPVQDTQ